MTLRMSRQAVRRASLGSTASAISGWAVSAVQESLVSEEVVHDLDTCEVTVEGEELNPEWESLEVDAAHLQHRGIEASSSGLGVTFTGERGGARQSGGAEPRPPSGTDAVEELGVGLLTRVSAGYTRPPRQGEDVQALPYVLPSRGRSQTCGNTAREGRSLPTATHFALAPAVRDPERVAGWLGRPGASLQPALALVPALPLLPASATISSRPPAGVDTMASYEEVLHLLRYRNWHSRSLLDRKFKLVCSELNGRYISNEFQVEVSAGLPGRRALCTALMFASTDF